jgi:hypothetical protein
MLHKTTREELQAIAAEALDLRDQRHGRTKV